MQWQYVLRVSCIFQSSYQYHLIQTGSAMIKSVAQHACVLFFVLASFITTADTIQIPLSGIGEVPSLDGLSINPSILENGEIEIGGQKVQEFSVSHIGDADTQNIDILSVEVGGQDSYDFVSDYVGYNTLEAGQTFNFSVTL